MLFKIHYVERISYCFLQRLVSLLTSVTLFGSIIHDIKSHLLRWQSIFTQLLSQHYFSQILPNAFHSLLNIMLSKRDFKILFLNKYFQIADHKDTLRVFKLSLNLRDFSITDKFSIHSNLLKLFTPSAGFSPQFHAPS